MQNFRAPGALTPNPQPPAAGGFDPVPPAAGGFDPKPPASSGWGLRPQTPKTAPTLRISGYAPGCLDAMMRRRGQQAHYKA